MLPVTGLRASGSGTDGERGRAARADPSYHIYDDPRFLANVRRLAERTKRNLRIMGGSPVAAKQFPDCVAVGGDSRWGCTGTLIAPSVVLTAGHCAKVATRVFFGSDVSKRGTIIGVKERHQHPKYHKGGKRNDLMVLILEKKAPPRPRAVASGAVIQAATDARAVGFGNVDGNGEFGYGIKRQVDLPIASSSCTGNVGGEQDSIAYGCDRMLEIVAGKPLLAKDSCTGDSGGPLYVQGSGGRWLLAGATSRATDSAMSNCGDGGIYVRVDKYLTWISSVAGVKIG
jgi:secreted trypsin-like serine protease